MIPPQTQQVLDFLGDPESYDPRPAAVQLHQTHASWVFVASPFVYKIKKPVNFGFMDFTTLEQRRANCDREVTLNRRLTQDIYLGVEAISIRDGRIQFGEEGEIVEWAVKMREMNAEDFLSHRIAEKRWELPRVGRKLVGFYRDQPPLDTEKSLVAARNLRENIAVNYLAARRFIPGCVSKKALDVIERYTRTFEDAHERLLAERVTAGAFRDCHGDLHLEHIHVTPDQINIYDCIEFNSAFREIDIACDIAFLGMDLDFHAEFELSRHVVTHVASLLDDRELPKLVDYYKCYRACVRGKVVALHSEGETVQQQERDDSLALSRRYWQLALRYALCGSTPTAFVLMGRVGTGKSSLANAFASETGWPVFSSDVVRKTFAGIPLTQRADASQRAALYAPEMTDRVYKSLTDSALSHLHRGQNVILDATFSSREVRDRLRRKVGVQLFATVWIEATASESTIRERLQARESSGNVISDAREEDFTNLQNAYEAPDELDSTDRLLIDTGADSANALDSLLSKLVNRNAR
jgi:uncharacterized protein